MLTPANLSVKVRPRRKTVAEIDRWYVRQLAVFLAKLQAAKDVAGKSLLHNAMII
jgi:hypothetical protein